MVLKSLGKKLKSVGKTKPKKKDDAPAPVVKTPVVGKPEGGIGGNAMALHGWKGAKPGPVGKSDAPKLGSQREDDKVTPKKDEGPKKWVKGVKPGAKTEKDKGKWTPGKKGGAERGPLTLGSRGKTKGGVDAPKTQETTTTTPKSKEQAKNPYLTTAYTTNPYLTNPYLVRQNEDDQSEVSADEPEVGGPKALEKGGDASPYTTTMAPAMRYRPFKQEPVSDSSPYRVYSQTFSSSEEEVSEDLEEQVVEGDHRKYKSVGTSAFQHSDANAPPVEGPKVDGPQEGVPQVEAGGGMIAPPLLYVNKNGEPVEEQAPQKESDKVDAKGEQPNIAQQYLTLPNNKEQQAPNIAQQYLTLPNNKEQQAPNIAQQYLTLPNNKEQQAPNIAQQYLNLPNNKEQQVPDIAQQYLTLPNNKEQQVPDIAQQYLTLPNNKEQQAPDIAQQYLTLNNGGPQQQGQDTQYTPLKQPGAGYANKYTMRNFEQSGSEGGQQLLSMSASQTFSSSEELPSVHELESKSQAPGKNLAPDVQRVAPESKDLGIAKMQENLRKGTRANKDVPEDVHGRSVPVTRGGKSKGESNSKGWGLLPMRDSYRNERQVGGKITKGLDRDLLKEGKATQYFVSRGETLEYEARKVLAANLKAGRGTKREDTIIRYTGGKWVGADNNVVDTTQVRALDYSINELRTKLTGKAQALQYSGLDKKLAKLQEQLKGLNSDIEGQQEQMRKMGAAGRYIFVMNGAGELFAGKSMTGVVHHSSFLAGGAVACAGEIAISGGQITAISNVSGHYRPGPAYLWQACKQLEMLGVPLDSLRVDVMGVNKNFKSAAEFLGAMDPASDPTMFDAGMAIEHLNRYFAEKSKNKHKEEEALKNAQEQKGEENKLTGAK